MTTQQTDAPRVRNNRSLNYMWVIVPPDRKAKLKRLTAKMESDKEQHPFKLNVNRVASMILCEAIDRMPEP